MSHHNNAYTMMALISVWARGMLSLAECVVLSLDSVVGSVFRKECGGCADSMMMLSTTH